MLDVTYPILRGLIIMPHSDDNMSLFVSCFDIPVGLGSLFQRVTSINDHIYLTKAPGSPSDKFWNVSSMGCLGNGQTPVLLSAA